jgi:hypothetical protein
VPVRMLGSPDADEVGHAVRAQLGPVRVIDWRVDELGRGRGDNATSLGVQRVHGRATSDRGVQDWSQIRKLFVAPTDADDQAEDHWNHWRREPRLLTSSLLRDLPDGVAAPQPYLVVDAGDRVTVWMTDAGPEPPDGWTDDALVTVADRLGRLAGAFVAHPPGEPWLSRDLLGQWAAGISTYAPALASSVAAGWDDRRVGRVHPRHGPVAAVLDAAAQLHAVQLGPVATLCHRDVGLENLRARGGTLTLFDWALAGPGPVGEDLGLLLASVARLPAIRPTVRADDLARGRPVGPLSGLLTAYIAGCAGVGAEVDGATVWRTAVVTAALRESIFAAAQLSTVLAGGVTEEDRLAAVAADAPAVAALATAGLALAGAGGVGAAGEAGAAR